MRQMAKRQLERLSNRRQWAQLPLPIWTRSFWFQLRVLTLKVCFSHGVTLYELTDDPHRSTEHDQVPEDRFHSPGFDILEHRSLSGLWIRGSSRVVHPSLRRSWCNICRYHCPHDLSFNVHGFWKSSLHASCTSDWKTPCISFVTFNIDRISGGSGLCRRLQHAFDSPYDVGFCCWTIRSTCSHDDTGMSF